MRKAQGVLQYTLTDDISSKAPGGNNCLYNSVSISSETMTNSFALTLEPYKSGMNHDKETQACTVYQYPFYHRIRVIVRWV